MTAVVERPDLSERTALSKSALAVAELCGQKAWLEIHDRRPFIPNPDVTFGSAVDAGVENLLTAARAGFPDTAKPLEAAALVIERDGIEVDFNEVERAITRFGTDVLPKYDWSFCRLQPHVNVPLEDWGEVDGHPDIVLASGAVYDVKTSKRAKETARSVELGLYALMVEEETGAAVPRVGYFAWVRLVKPYWQVIESDVTEDFRSWTRERVAAYVRAKRADELLNRRAEVPVNWTFPSGPKNAGLCLTCQYNPLMGGPCRMAPTGTDG
jgi:hypothetical protein